MGQTGSKDLVDTAIGAGNFSMLAKALSTAGLVNTLKGPGPYTVFAPTDDAFRKLPKADLDALLADKEKLKAVLLYHVVPGRVGSADVTKMTDGAHVKTASGKAFTLHLQGGTVAIDDATVTQTDIGASNGVIHVIDTVIIPR